MEAKDTVKPVPHHSESIWCPHCGEEFGIESQIETERETQADISFKAGIEEVVDWIKEMANIENFKDAPKLIGFTMLSEDLQSQLKKWGISED